MLDLTASVGEVLSFEWFAGSFDVYLMRHSNAFRKCDFYGAKLIGSTSPTRYTLTSLPAYFASKQYCAAGQKLAVFEGKIMFYEGIIIMSINITLFLVGYLIYHFFICRLSYHSLENHSMLHITMTITLSLWDTTIQILASK